MKHSDEHADMQESTRAGGISRRTFIQGVVVASAATGFASAPLSALSRDVAETAMLSGRHRAVLTSVLNHLIPREGTMPAAGDIGIGSFIEQAIGAAPHLRQPITAVLDALPDGDALNQLGEEEVRNRLEAVERAQADAFDLLVQATYTGYYRHPAVLSALKAEPDQLGELRLDGFHPDDLDRLSEGA